MNAILRTAAVCFLIWGFMNLLRSTITRAIRDSRKDQS